MSKEIIINCECGGSYTRPVVANSKKSQDLVLDYAVCPHCKTARFPAKIAAYDKKDLCVECGVPNMIIGNRKAARGMCWRCYKILLKRKNERNHTRGSK